MNKFKERINFFNKSIIAARLLAKIGSESLKDFPNNLPEKEKINYRNAAERTLKKIKEDGGLEWEEMPDGSLRASPRLEDPQELGIANDIFFLSQTSKIENPAHNMFLNGQIAFEQCVIISFSQLNTLLQDILKEIFKKDNRLIKNSKKIEFEEIIKTGSYDQLKEKMISILVSEFEYLSFSKKMNYLKEKIGLEIEIPEKMNKNLLFAEQARHLFTHTGGFVSNEFVQKTKTDYYEVGDRISLDFKYCYNFTDGIIKIGNHIFESALEKFWEKKK